MSFDGLIIYSLNLSCICGLSIEAIVLLISCFAGLVFDKIVCWCKICGGGWKKCRKKK